MKAKAIVVVSSLVAAVAGIVCVTTHSTSSAHKTFVLNPGSYFNPVHPGPGDTVFLSRGQYGYLSWRDISGDSLNPIIVMGDSAVMDAGFEYNDCSYWHIAGGISIVTHKPSPANVAFKIQGKCNGFEIENVYFDNIYSAIWFKTECNEYKDSSYWGDNMVMNGLYWHDCEVHHCHFEGAYIGSTDQSGKRPAVGPDGKTYYPFPPKVKNIRIKNIFMDSCWRTGIQVSGLESSDSYIKACQIRNSGQGHESDQGAAFRLGGRSKDFTITNCTFTNSWLYAVQSQGSGMIKFTKNTIDSATKGGSSANPQGMAAIQFDNATYPTTLKIKDNIIGWSNTGVACVIYANKNGQFTPDNVYINNKTKGTFVNNTDAVFKTNE